MPTKVIPKRQNQLSKKRKSKADKPSPWIDRLKDGENKNDVPASAKTLTFKSDILNLFQLDTNAKIIIFREWREMLDILERVCEIEGWNCVKIHGQVSIAEGNARLDAFRTGDFSVLLSSKKCGGAGLNLTEAQAVTINNPWWNSAAEVQAFGRVHRIGQKNKTRLTRFFIEGGIEGKMIKLQEKKDLDISQAMLVFFTR
jgi:SNF2 family DNA or RNA helicase